MSAPITTCPVISTPTSRVRCTDVVNSGAAKASIVVPLSSGSALVRAQAVGAAGNSITVACVQPDVETAMSVAIAGSDITITLAADALGEPVASTYAEVLIAWAASAANAAASLTLYGGVATAHMVPFAAESLGGGKDADGCTCYDTVNEVCGLLAPAV